MASRTAKDGLKQYIMSGDKLESASVKGNNSLRETSSGKVPNVTVVHTSKGFRVMASRGGMFAVYRNEQFMYGSHKRGEVRREGTASPSLSPRRRSPNGSGTISPVIIKDQNGNTIERRAPKIVPLRSASPVHSGCAHGPTRTRVLGSTSSPGISPQPSLDTLEQHNQTSSLSNRSNSAKSCASEASQTCTIPENSHFQTVEERSKPELTSSDGTKGTPRLLRSSESRGTLEINLGSPQSNSCQVLESVFESSLLSDSVMGLVSSMYPETIKTDLLTDLSGSDGRRRRSPRTNSGKGSRRYSPREESCERPKKATPREGLIESSKKISPRDGSGEWVMRSSPREGSGGKSKKISPRSKTIESSKKISPRDGSGESPREVSPREGSDEKPRKVSPREAEVRRHIREELTSSVSLSKSNSAPISSKRSRNRTYSLSSLKSSGSETGSESKRKLSAKRESPRLLEPGRVHGDSPRFDSYQTSSSTSLDWKQEWQDLEAFVDRRIDTTVDLQPEDRILIVVPDSSKANDAEVMAVYKDLSSIYGCLDYDAFVNIGDFVTVQIKQVKEMPVEQWEESRKLRRRSKSLTLPLSESILGFKKEKTGQK